MFEHTCNIYVLSCKSLCSLSQSFTEIADGTSKFPSKSLSHNDSADKDSSVPNSESQSNENVSLVQLEIIAPNVQRKQPLKLHWGYSYFLVIFSKS